MKLLSFDQWDKRTRLNEGRKSNGFGRRLLLEQGDSTAFIDSAKMKFNNANSEEFKKKSVINPGGDVQKIADASTIASAFLKEISKVSKTEEEKKYFENLMKIAEQATQVAGEAGNQDVMYVAESILKDKDPNCAPTPKAIEIAANWVRWHSGEDGFGDQGDTYNSPELFKTVEGGYASGILTKYFERASGQIGSGNVRS